MFTGCDKFGYQRVQCIVLEEDGTEIEEDYFRTLPDNCKLMALQVGERWTSASDASSGTNSGEGKLKALKYSNC